jgi:ATP-binding cassette subfamily F protein uup
MNLISIEQISKKYGDKLLFEGVSFGISKGQKIALVAPNGSGKSSLLKLIVGTEQADSGIISVRNGIRLGLLEQDPYFDPDATVLDTLFDSESPVTNAYKAYYSAIEANDMDAIQVACDLMDTYAAWDFEAKAGQVLSQLSIHFIKQPIRSLSGGQKRRLALAILLLSEPDILLLDEPTNHLDIRMIEWLEKYLSQNHITLFMITHDRYFLDRVCTAIIELDRQTLFRYDGNYAYFLEKREERYRSFESSLEKTKNLYARELEWVRKQPKARTTKSQSRVDAFDELKEKAHQRIVNRQLALKSKITRLGGKVINLEKVGKTYTEGESWLFKDFSYRFLAGERVGILGDNGSGKSTLLKAILGKLQLTEGRIDMGETVLIGYFGQEGISYKPGQRVIEWVKEIAEHFDLADGLAGNASQLLERFLFPRHMHYTPIEKLSGGEKRRLYLLSILVGSPNVLILDEPTNDLDLMTLAVLEEFLESFAGTLIIVSHDRFFLDKLVDHLFIFDDSTPEGIKDFPGNYSQYFSFVSNNNENVSNQKEKKTNEEPAPAPKTAEMNAVKTKLSFKEQYEFKQLEIEIIELEERKKNLTEILNSGSLNHQALQETAQELQEIMSGIETKENRWLELSMKNN